MLYTDPSGDICEDCSGSPGVNNGGTATSTDLAEFGRDTGITKWARKNLNFNSWRRSRDRFLGRNKGNDNPNPAPQPNVSKYVNVKTTGSGQYYGGDGSGSLLDYFSRFVYEVDQFNPIALAWDGIKGNVNGTDRYGNELSGFDANMKIVTAIPMTKVGGVLVNVGERALLTEAKTSVKSILTGGKTFEQYKRAYWAGRTKPVIESLIDRKTGQSWKQFMELHHRFIPQRAKWAPNWLKNNRFNLQELNSLEHAMKDPYRARFAPKWVKEYYNLNWK